MSKPPVQRSEVLRISDLLIRFLQSGQMYARTTSYAGGLSPGALRATIRLAAGGPAMVGDIATSLGVSASWASRAVDELVRAGLADRVRSEVDRRVVDVRLTARATQWIDEVVATHGAIVARALSSLDADERAAVCRFLDDLVSGYADEEPSNNGHTAAAHTPPAAGTSR